MIKSQKITNIWSNNKFDYSAYYEKRQMQLVLLIIMVGIKFSFG